MNYLLIGLACFLFGVVAGVAGAQTRWRENARHVYGLESGGTVYKVLYQRHYHQLINHAETSWEFLHEETEA